MSISDLDRTEARTDRAALEEALRDAGATIRGTTATCPFHGDRHPSASLYRDDAGTWRVKCHGCGFGGDVFDVRARATGQPIGEVLPRTGAPRHDRQKQPPPRVYATVDELAASFGLPIEAEYRYTDPTTGRVDLIVVRLRKPDGCKTFRQGRPCGDGYAVGAPPKPSPLYGRPRMVAAPEVVVVEGEKCVHALAGLGIVATTSPCGAGKAAYADWTPLAGKTAYLWPDNDSTGREHMQAVGSILETLEPPCRVHLIEPEELGLGPKGDAADYIEGMADATADQRRRAVLEAIRTAHPVGCAEDLAALIEDIISGEREAIPWPWPSVGKLTRALLPGTVTLLVGAPGAAKSFMLLQACLHWHAAGRRIALFELEEDRAYHLHRALALQVGNGDLLDDEWVRDNPDDAREAYSLQADFLDGFGKRIFEAPDEEITADELAAWVERMADAGVEIIAVDPVTAVKQSHEPWIQDQRFLIRVKQAVRRTGARLILVTHPKKARQQGRLGLDDLAGGASWQRFAQTVLWLERHAEPKTFEVQTPFGPTTATVNRVLHVCKARNGPGGGLKLAMHMDGSLRLREEGTIVRKPKRRDAAKDESDE